MKYFTLNLNEKEINFRIASGDALELEDKYKMSLQEFIQKISNTNCVTLLKYMRKSSDAGFTNTKANELFDELVDNGYSLQSIYMKVIFPTCVVSGILTQEDLDRINKAVEKKTTEAEEKLDSPKSN